MPKTLDWLNLSYDGTGVRMVPGPDGVVPVKDQAGRIVGKVVDAIPGAGKTVAMVIELDRPMESVGSLTIDYRLRRRQ